MGSLFKSHKVDKIIFLVLYRNKTLVNDYRPESKFYANKDHLLTDFSYGTINVIKSSLGIGAIKHLIDGI